MLKCWQVSLKPNHTNLSPLLSWKYTLTKCGNDAAATILVGVHALCWRLATFTLGRAFTLTLASCSLAPIRVVVQFWSISFFLHEVLASSPPFLSLNTSKVRIDTSVIIDGERMILPHNGDAHILVGQVNLWVRCSFLKRAGPVPTSLGRVSLSALRPCFTSSSNSHSCRSIIRHVYFCGKRRYPKVIEELLQVGPGSLGPSSNGHCSAV